MGSWQNLSIKYLYTLCLARLLLYFELNAQPKIPILNGLYFPASIHSCMKTAPLLFCNPDDNATDFSLKQAHGVPYTPMDINNSIHNHTCGL